MQFICQKLKPHTEISKRNEIQRVKNELEINRQAGTAHSLLSTELCQPEKNSNIHVIVNVDGVARMTTNKS